MFLGHFALAFAAKKAAPQASLGTLTMAAAFIDLLWPTLLLLGVERVRIDTGQPGLTPLVFEHYPVSHSLVAVIAWAAALGALYFARTRLLVPALVVAVLVASHWVLDAVVHRPDLPIVPGGDMMVGLGLWNSAPATLAVECALMAGGLWLYRSAVRGRGLRRLPIAAYVATLAVIYFANLFGPPPPGVEAIAIAGHAQWLLVLMAWWADRPRAAPAVAAA
jgi:hypothetical protein